MQNQYPQFCLFPHIPTLRQKLLGSDTDGQDGFGHSVSVDESNELLVVGAPYAEDNGVSEVCVEGMCLFVMFIWAFVLG